MERILRGEIWWADLNPTRSNEQSGIRPVLIISHEWQGDQKTQAQLQQMKHHAFANLFVLSEDHTRRLCIYYTHITRREQL
jgi:hypothetical protein